MPVSPADFEFYSRMTGQPIPNTPAGRMAIAPQVYAMRRSPLSKVGDFISGAGKAAALAGGAVAGAALLSQISGKRGDSASQEDLAPQEDSKEKEATDLIENLQAQGAREREATASARALQASDAKAYRGMVKDTGDKIISELVAQGQPNCSCSQQRSLLVLKGLGQVRLLPQLKILMFMTIQTYYLVLRQNRKQRLKPS